MTAHIREHLSTLETDPIRNFRFLVDINHGGINTKIGFTQVAGLSVSTEPIAYREGGMNTSPQQIPGQTTFTPITLQRGVIIGSKANWLWMTELFNVKVGTGTGRSAKGGPTFRADIDIYVLEHPITKDAGGGAGTEINAPVKVRVYNAWPSSISYSDLNAGDNALFVEQMTLAHEGFALHWADGLSRDAADF